MNQTRNQWSRAQGLPASKQILLCYMGLQVMWKTMLRKYADSTSQFSRIPKTRWISFVMDLEQFSVPQEPGQITIRQATQEDVEILRHHPESGEKIFHSALTFWDVYGFRSLYLGYFEDEPDPSIFQYVLDHTANPIYRKMAYGGMYLQQSPISVQVENLYAFKKKRRKNIALKFEWALFGLLKNTGKKQVRTHIEEHNLPTIGWAEKVGLKPDAWVTMVSPDLPILRYLKPQFVYTPIRDRGYLQEPLLPDPEWGMRTASGHQRVHKV